MTDSFSLCIEGDMTHELVRHFLIETGPRGVKLKGCPNEPNFGELPLPLSLRSGYSLKPVPGAPGSSQGHGLCLCCASQTWQCGGAVGFLPLDSAPGLHSFPGVSPGPADTIST